MIVTMIVVAAMAQGPSLSREADVDDLVRRMMAFDKDGDGMLTRAEIVDARLLGLFDRADADEDGSVTKTELIALGEAEHSDTPGFGPPPGGPPPGGAGFDGFPGTPAARPGEVLSPPVRQALRLTPEQIKRVDEVQSQVDAALAEILTDVQKRELQAAADRPGRRRPPGGRPR